ncbi:MAG: hypothetical protein ACPGSB_01990 [Opitutales bacterium]
MKNYIFLHVPKTAGSMFRQIVKSNFAEEAFIDNPLMSELCYSSRQIERLFYLYPFRFYMGHVYRLQACLDANVETELISFVRDPIEKAFSSYYYLRGRGMTHANHPTKRHTFIEMVEYYLNLQEADSFDLDSGQLKWLLGARNCDLSLVKESVESGRLHLFPTAAFDDACIVLEKLFPQDFKDCSYESRVNVSSKENNDSLKEAYAAAERLPWIEEDRKLLKLAEESFESKLVELGLTGPALEDSRADFKERCLPKVSLEENKPSPSTLRKVKNRLLRRIKH